MSMDGGLKEMIDFHSHVMPSMDDGADSPDETAAMLTESVRQGVHTVVATPHFYRSQESIESFLDRRAVSARQMADRIPNELRVVLGAEVLLQKGLSKQDLSPLCIEGTRQILVELPFTPPSAWLYEELENIALGQRLDVILAHVDRYMMWYTRREMAAMMNFPGLTVQLNGEAFLEASVFRALRRWLPAAERVVFGSDMHHADTRTPNLGPAFQKLKRKSLGRQWIEQSRQDGPALLLPLQ